MPRIATDRLEIHYEEAGAGPNVFVFVHGNFGSWRWWQPMFDRLPPGYRAYAPDLRGCGETPGGGSGEAYEIPQLAEDLLAFVEALGVRSFHLVGHSLGGGVALQFALAHPERVKSLTLVAPAPAAGLEVMRAGSSPSAVLLKAFNPENAGSMAVLQASYGVHHALGTNRLMLGRALAKMMPSATLERAARSSLLHDAAQMSAAAVVGFLKALHRWNVADLLWTLHIPTLIVAGGKDGLVPQAALEEMANQLPRGRLVVWPDVGHSAQVERPDEFMGLLVEGARRSYVMRARTWLWRARRSLAGGSQKAGAEQGG
ncbi:MAG: alpha/beta fold hydrolase [Anaeromyxobacteraceae bacterium]